MHRYLSIWQLTSDGEKSISIGHDTLLAELEALSPSVPGQETLNLLWEEGLIELDIHGRYLLSAQGLGFRKLIPDKQGKGVMVENSFGQWNEFRQILKYYIDCVSAQEKRQEYLNPNKEHKTFLIPVLPFGWLKELGKNTNDTITITTTRKDASAHGRITTRQDDEEEIYIGYPIAVHQDKDTKSLYFSPIATIPVELLDSSNTTLMLRLRYDECEINQTWVEYHIPEESQRAFKHKMHSLAEGDFKGLFDLFQALPILESQMDLEPNSLDPNHMDFVLPTTNKPCVVNVPVLFIGKPLKYSKSLKNELEHILKVSDQELDQTALAHVFRKTPLETSEQETEFLPLPFIDSNPEQRLAISNALNQPVSKITGPPGTGKSQVAINIIANLLFHEKSVLFTSRNHKAIHAIADRSEDILKQGASLPLVNFCSSPDGKTVNPWFKQEIDIAIAKARDIKKQPDNLKIQEVEDSEREWLDNEHYLAGRSDILQKLGQLNSECEYIRKSIRTRLHIDSIGELDERRITEIRKNYQNISKVPLTAITWRTPLRKIRWLISGRKKHSAALVQITQCFPELCQRNHDFIIIRHVLATTVQDWERLNKKIAAISEIETKAKKLPEIAKITSAMQRIMKELKDALSSALFCRRMQKLQELHDTHLIDFLKSVMQQTRQRNNPFVLELLPKEELQKADSGFKRFLEFYPAWAVTLLSLSKSSPCLPGVFDTVIIDEASQCDIPSSIPALYRAKHVVVIGDPNQFPPVIDLDPKRHEYLKFIRHKLVHLADARFDFLTNTTYSCVNVPPTILREHFRCHEEIADFCNQVYYNNNWIVRTNPARLNFPRNMGFRPGIEWIDVKCSIDDEIQEAYKHVETLKKNGYLGTIGVITPFRSLADRLKMKMHGLLEDEDVNTVNGFQGGERDVILFVLGYTSQLKQGLNWYAEAQENRFIYNVAVSRARACLLVIGDKEHCKQSPCQPLRKLAELPFQNTNTHPERPQFDSIWEERFFNALAEAGIHAKTQYPVAGRRLDLAIIDGDFKLDIEVDGVKFHTNSQGERNLDDIFRDIQVSSAGWHVQRFWVYQLREEMAECVKKVEERIARKS